MNVGHAGMVTTFIRAVRSKTWNASVMLTDPIDQAVKDAAKTSTVQVTVQPPAKISSPLLGTKSYPSLAKMLERK